MTSILGSLGLGDVTADPNEIPDGKYAGNVTQSKILLSKDGSKLMHLIEYTVADGQFKGAQRPDFQVLGTDIVKDEAGNITAFTNTMTDQNKQWYKKRLVTDLGAPEAEVDGGTFDIASLVGTPVNFGIKRNNGYVNVNFVEKREGTAAAAAAPAGVATELL